MLRVCLAFVAMVLMFSRAALKRIRDRGLFLMFGCVVVATPVMLKEPIQNRRPNADRLIIGTSSGRSVEVFLNGTALGSTPLHLSMEDFKELRLPPPMDVWTSPESCWSTWGPGIDCLSIAWPYDRFTTRCLSFRSQEGKKLAVSGATTSNPVTTGKTQILSVRFRPRLEPPLATSISQAVSGGLEHYGTSFSRGFRRFREHLYSRFVPD